MYKTEPFGEFFMSLMREMLEAGVHFGHQTRYWNPKMAEYIFGQRNKIHIVNLERTVEKYLEATQFVRQVAARGGNVLFVGTKRSARELVAAEAQRCGMPYVDSRWLGGMMTNFKTVKTSIKRLKDMEAQQAEGATEQMSKKEALMFAREMDKLYIPPHRVFYQTNPLPILIWYRNRCFPVTPWVEIR